MPLACRLHCAGKLELCARIQFPAIDGLQEDGDSWKCARTFWSPFMARMLVPRGYADHDPAAKRILEDTLIDSGERLTATKARLDGRLKALAAGKE